MIQMSSLATLCVFIILLVCLMAPITGGPPNFVNHDTSGRHRDEYPQKQYSIAENPNAKYKPNLPEELRAKYVGQSWSQEVYTEVCWMPPDSGYYCVGAVGDMVPFRQRFYYDIRSRQCRCFFYLGCDGNQNNFKSVDHCHNWCSPNRTITDRLLRTNWRTFATHQTECLHFY